MSLAVPISVYFTAARSPPRSHPAKSQDLRPRHSGLSARSDALGFFNKLKQFRRIATRYEKLAANYLAMIKLATIRIWLRGNESTS